MSGQWIKYASDTERLVLQYPRRCYLRPGKT